jgi:kumamolisin
LVFNSAAQAQTAPTIDAVINLKSRVSMDALADSVMNPSSPRFHRFYSPDEIRSIAAPSLEQYKQLVSDLQSAGFTILHHSRSGMHITVRGSADLYQRLFNVQLQYLHGNPRIHRIASMPRIPSNFPLIESISGLNNFTHKHPKYALAPQQPGFSAKPMGYLPAQIHALYGLDALYAKGLTGKGQHIAIATYDDFHLNDVQNYFKQMNLPSPAIDVVRFNGTPNLDPNSAIETQVDAEFSGMIAPGAMIHVFTSATNDEAGELAMFTAILDDNRAKIINYSWGECEPTVNPQHRADMDQIFARAVAQGVNIQVASGDNGSKDCNNDPNAPNQGVTATDFPSASPNVVSVGGTTIQSVSGNVPMQTAWSGSGGGFSTLYPKPDWQVAAGIGGPAMRGVPDVSFNADPKSGEPAWVTNPDTNQASYLQIGGTSIAAPQWSGFLALVGEARNGNPIGLITPIIYKLSNSQRAELFMDITEGSNGDFSAAVGWDPVTGFGPMQGVSLLQFLAQQ